MSLNTGFQQSIYAAKFATKGSDPLDVDGNLCSISGKKQAILLLEGYDNPDPTRFEVSGTFSPTDVIDGYPSIVYNPDACPLPQDNPESNPDKLPEYEKDALSSVYIRLNPDIPSVVGEGYNVMSRDWDNPVASFDYGGENKGTYATRRIGEYEWTLQNWRMCYNSSRNYGDYIVDQAVLDQSGIAMTEEESNQKNGCYVYGGSATTRFLSGLEFYTHKYEKEGINQNLFDKSQITNFNVKDGIIITDPNTISFKIDNVPPRTSYTMSRLGSTNEFKIYSFWSTIKVDNNQLIRFADSGDEDKVTEGTGTMPFSMLFVISSDGTKLKDLPPIKIEVGTEATEYIEHKTELQVSEWRIPSLNDFMQLLGMIGSDLSPTNVMKHLFVSPTDTELPWISSFNTASSSQDLLGARLIPCGHKRNTTLANGGLIYQFGERMAYGLSGGEDLIPVIYFNMASGNKIGSVVYDDYFNIEQVDASVKGWQRNYRFCRPLSDSELGYRLWRDDVNDKILVTTLEESQPDNTIELEKGLLRGLAVRWMNKDKTIVLASLSQLLNEIETTKNGGSANWYGFYQ